MKRELLAFVTIVTVATATASDKPLITSGDSTSLWHHVPMVNTHLGPQGFVTFGGKTYKPLAGYAPYFITVRGSDAVVFVELLKNGRTLHIAKLQSGKCYSFPGFSSYFGNWIGRTSLGPLEYDEAITLSDGRILLRHSIAAGCRDTIVNLISGKIESSVDVPRETAEIKPQQNGKR